MNNSFIEGLDAIQKLEHRAAAVEYQYHIKYPRAGSLKETYNLKDEHTINVIEQALKDFNFLSLDAN